MNPHRACKLIHDALTMALMDSTEENDVAHELKKSLLKIADAGLKGGEAPLSADSRALQAHQGTQYVRDDNVTSTSAGSVGVTFNPLDHEQSK